MLEIDSIIILGGGCYGSLFFDRLKRGKKKGLVSYSYQIIVDRNERCQLKKEARQEDIIFYKADWIEFLVKDYPKIMRGRDYLVLPCFGPHFIFQYIETKLKEHRGYEMRLAVFKNEIGVPFEKDVENNKYLSFAQWRCPVLCVEPPRCPAINKIRSWNLKDTLISYFKNNKEIAEDNIFIFEIGNYTNGVAMIEAKRVVEAFEKLIRRINERFQTFIIATVSKCHGVASLVELRRRI